MGPVVAVMDKITKDTLHLALLVKGWPLIVRFNRLVRFRAGYSLDVSCFTVTVAIRQNGYRSCPEAVVGEVRVNACSLIHRFLHVVESACFDRHIAKPNFINIRVELMASYVSWLLEKGIQFGIQMGQVIFNGFNGTSCRFRNGKNLRVRFFLRICKPVLMVFC